MDFDALLLLSFGGPEGPEDVGPFLDNVLRGRPIPAERVEQVAAHYMRFGGRSPINDQNRALVRALEQDLSAHGRSRPVYWGNRNWHPLLADTVEAMRDDGVRRAAVFVTSAYSSYSGCRQYLEDLEVARAGIGPGAPQLIKLRPYYNHPGFVEPLAAGLAGALEAVDGRVTAVLMSAHSIPVAAAATCDYEAQLRCTAAAVAERAGLEPEAWQLVFQSRSGPSEQPWLGPDVVEAIEGLPAGVDSVVVAPVGFVSDHMEVVYDLDVQAAQAAGERGLAFVRSPTPGTHPRFVHMVSELMDELAGPGRPRPVVGRRPPAPVPCLPGCCPAGMRPGRAGRR